MDWLSGQGGEFFHLRLAVRYVPPANHKALRDIVGCGRTAVLYEGCAEVCWGPPPPEFLFLDTECTI